VAGASNGVPFRARGVRVLEPGWTVLYPRRKEDAKEEEQELPEFRPGESGPHEPSIRRGETTPPKPYTEGTLLGAMETAGKLVDDEELKEALKERGLGTPATRAAIIETLLARGYITREKKALAATDLGRYLVALVRDRALKSPELTGEWEAKLREIERGRLDPGRFRDEIVRYTAEIIRAEAGPGVDEGRLGDCPRCGRPVIEGKRSLGCSGWKAGCPFVLPREYKGHRLEDGQVRELLQRRVVLEPPAIEGTGEVVLQLADSGAVLEIPVPKGWSTPPNRAAGGRNRPRRMRKNAGRDVSGPPEPAEVSRQEGGATMAFGARPNSKGTRPALGTCPLCGSEVVEQPRSYGCGRWRDGCKFAIWKEIAGRPISPGSARALLRRGRSPLLKGFRSRSGRTFESRLKLEEGAVRFDFGSEDPAARDPDPGRNPPHSPAARPPRRQ
jgi:DNA topoisomerase-3